MPRYRADVTVAALNSSDDDHLEDDETFDDVAVEEHAVSVAVVERKDTDVRYHSIYCVVNNTEIAPKHSSET